MRLLCCWLGFHWRLCGPLRRCNVSGGWTCSLVGPPPPRGGSGMRGCLLDPRLMLVTRLWVLMWPANRVGVRAAAGVARRHRAELRGFAVPSCRLCVVAGAHTGVGLPTSTGVVLGAFVVTLGWGFRTVLGIRRWCSGKVLHGDGSGGLADVFLGEPPLLDRLETSCALSMCAV